MDTAIEYHMRKLIPPHMWGAVRRYVNQGISPGSFMTAVLENNLTQAFCRADDINTQYMRNWADFVYNHMPSNCHGTPEKVAAWLERGGLHGMQLEVVDGTTDSL